MHLVCRQVNFFAVKQAIFDNYTYYYQDKRMKYSLILRQYVLRCDLFFNKHYLESFFLQNHVTNFHDF